MNKNSPAVNLHSKDSKKKWRAKAAGGLVVAGAIAFIATGGGTGAFWSATNPNVVAEEGFMAGLLSIAPLNVGTWSDHNSLDGTVKPVDPATYRLVPGDKLQYAESTNINISGDNMLAELHADMAGLSGTLAAAGVAAELFLVEGVYTSDVPFANLPPAVAHAWVGAGATTENLAAFGQGQTLGSGDYTAFLLLSYDEGATTGDGESLTLGAVDLRLEQVRQLSTGTGATNGLVTGQVTSAGYAGTYDPVEVTFYDINGNWVTSSFLSSSGELGVLVDPGQYKVFIDGASIGLNSAWYGGGTDQATAGVLDVTTAGVDMGTITLTAP